MTIPSTLAVDGGRRLIANDSAASQRAVSSIERQWSDATGQAHVIVCSSGPVAAQLGLAGLQLGPGDEVICPAGTFFTSAGATGGATTAHVDVDPMTLHIDPDAVAAAINHRTAAIIALDLYGTAADFDALESVAGRHGLPLLEDASQAQGARLGQRPAGSLGTASFASLPGAGPPGEGGVLATGDSDLAAAVRRTMLVDDQLCVDQPLPASGAVGWTYRLSDPEATAASAELGRLDEETAARTANGNHLRCQLRDLAGIELPEAVPGATHVYSSFPFLVQPGELGLPDSAVVALRETILAALSAEGLPVDRWRPEPIGGGEVRRPPVVDTADHPVADAVRVPTLLLGRGGSFFGSEHTARTMDEVAACFHKVVVENRDQLRRLTEERVATSPPI
jgi:dTDP-4-amino-4,6-dideoxygalactose transaminase